MAKKPAAPTRPEPEDDLVNPNVATSDPLNINARLYRQIARLLDDLEAADVKEMLDIKERIAALIAVARIQTVFVTLRKEGKLGPTSRSAGSAVRKYASAFKANAGGRRAPRSRSAAADLGGDDFGDDGDDAA